MASKPYKEKQKQCKRNARDAPATNTPCKPKLHHHEENRRNYSRQRTASTHLQAPSPDPNTPEGSCSKNLMSAPGFSGNSKLKSPSWSMSTVMCVCVCCLIAFIGYSLLG